MINKKETRKILMTPVASSMYITGAKQFGRVMGQNKSQIIWVKVQTENPARPQISLTLNIPLRNKKVILNALTLTFFANIKFVLN